MPVNRLLLRVPLEDVSARIDALLEDSDLTVEFPPEVLREAEEAARSWRERTAEHADMTDLEFLTLDPESSTDLDQAMFLERDGEGYRVRYAIADVPLFVEPDGPLDDVTRERGLTVYLPDRRIPLHPTVISEEAGSLLPGKDSPAFVWDFRLDERAEVTAVDLTRATVRNREKLAYDAVQRDLDAGTAHPQMTLLQEIGDKRAVLEIERGGASLNTPEQEIVESDEHLRLEWRKPARIEDANAQISLMTGMAAATIMLESGTGILRTMPPAPDAAIRRFRAQARALREPWPEDMPYGAFLRTLDWQKGRHLALLNQATALFRGAGYTAFTGGDKPETTIQAAIAAPYAHTTAPLRRLVDRFSLLVCHAHVSGAELDPRILRALEAIPDAMEAAQRRNNQIEKSAREIVELAVLEQLVGEEMTGTVLEFRDATAADQGTARPARVQVQFSEPPTEQWIPTDGPIEVGTKVSAVLTGVDLERRRATFEMTTLADQPSAEDPPADGTPADQSA